MVLESVKGGVSVVLGLGMSALSGLGIISIMPQEIVTSAPSQGLLLFVVSSLVSAIGWLGKKLLERPSQESLNRAYKELDEVRRENRELNDRLLLMAQKIGSMEHVMATRGILPGGG